MLYCIRGENIKIQTAIRIEKDLWLWIKKHCKKQGLTVTGLITNILLKVKKDDNKNM